MPPVWPHRLHYFTIIILLYFTTSHRLALAAINDTAPTPPTGDNETTNSVATADKPPGCNGTYQEVLIRNWIAGDENSSYIGISAEFGALLPSDFSAEIKFPAVLASPLDNCNSSSKLSNSIVVATRGGCAFDVKAQVAQLNGAAGLLLINDDEDLVQMAYTGNDASLNIRIPVVMIAKSDGDAIQKSLSDGTKVDIVLYSPKKPLLTISNFFALLMATATIVCASLWDNSPAPEKTDERYDQLEKKTKPPDTDGEAESEIITMDVLGAVVFIIVSSVLLLCLYKFMSSWIVWLVIVLFCIGGTQGVHNVIVALISRVFKGCGQMSVDVPVLGKVLVLSLIVLPLSAVFAISWATHQQSPHAWIGQDILAVCFLMNALHQLQLPNIKVAAVLLCLAFCYDIFWVFLSPLIFHESVMVAVARGGDGEVSFPMVLKIPSASPWGGYTLLGFGDILLPGLLLTFGNRFDKAREKGLFNGYFFWLVTGYVFGLSITYLGFYLMDGHGQPALLYLVPCTLGLTVLPGGIRKELNDLWNFKEKQIVPTGGEAA